jgi:hypothetical protein
MQPTPKKKPLASLFIGLSKICIALTAINAALQSFAQSATEQDQGSALHDAQNPISSAVQVPIQSNTYLHVGPYNKTANVTIIEPVIPVKLTADWNLVMRWITPLVYLPRLSPMQGSTFGLGNLQPEFYLSPAHAGPIIWGLGPKVYLPTATDKELGLNKWGGGPAAVALTIQGPWVGGIIANNVWAGTGKHGINEPGDQGYNQMTLNPFVYYNIGKTGWYIISSPVITSDWVAKSDNRWIVPVGGGIGRLFKIGSQPINARVQVLDNVVRGPGQPTLQVQAQVQFIFPKSKAPTTTYSK